jgi:hypothetical protein
MRTSKHIVCITFLLFGTLTSTTVAQTVEPEINPSSVAIDTAAISESQTLAEVDGTSPAQVETDASQAGGEEKQGEKKLGEEERQQSLAEEVQGETISPTPGTSPASSANKAPTLETADAQTAAIPPDTQLHSPKSLEEVDLPPRTLKEAGFLSQTANPEPSPSPSETSPADTPPTLETPPSPDTTPTPQTTPETKPDTTPNPETTPETAPATTQVSPLRITPRFGVQFTSGDGLGYESFFYGFEGFVPLGQTPGQNVTFLEGRLLISDDDGEPGGNIIIGRRFYSPNRNRVFGAYVGYDIRDTGQSVFNQLGAGIEALGETWDVRANAYFPIGDNRRNVEENTIESVLPFSQPVFQGNFLALGERQGQISRRYEAAMTGFDVEAGMRIIPIGTTGDVRGYAGIYRYDAPGRDSFWGGRVRVEARPIDNIRVGLALQTDDAFGTDVVLNLALSFPPIRRGTSPRERVLARMGESVTRQQNIVVEEQFELINLAGTAFATNPATGEPWFFQHVTSSGTAAGNGTVESPFGQVQQAQDVAQTNNIIYVQGVAGGSSSTSTRQLPDGVRLLSSGPVQQIETRQGNIQLPGSGTGVRPRITGAIALGNNNTVSGFEINGATGSGIRGTNINSATIRENTISNSRTADPTNIGDGIFLSNATGRIDISNNTITNNNEGSAISIGNNTGQVELNIGSNAIANNANAIQFGLLGTAQGTAQITNNTITNSGIGIDVNLGGSAQLNNATISNNTVEGSTQGTRVPGTEAQGIRFRASDNAQGTLTMSGNTFRNLAEDAMFFSLNQSSRTQLTISGNTLNTSEVAFDVGGIDIEMFDNAVSTFTISNNQIANPGEFGIVVDANGNSQLQLLIESNTITGSSNAGISLFSLGGGNSQISTTVRLNTLTGNNLGSLATGSFEAQTFDAGSICLQLVNNTSDTFALTNNGSGILQAQVGTNTGTVTPIGTTAAPPFSGCTVP